MRAAMWMTFHPSPFPEGEDLREESGHENGHGSDRGNDRVFEWNFDETW